MDYLLCLVIKALLLCLMLGASVYCVFLLPPRHPLGIPCIPFWVALVPLVQDVDQEIIFRKYIEKPQQAHGAVKIFFGSQWNVLVHRSTYLAKIFKREDEYQKSGNQKKIPHSVLASFLGDNIISSHGTVWRPYQGIVKPSLQRPLDHGIIFANAYKLCNLLLHKQTMVLAGGIPVQEILQRYTTANFAQVMLRTDFGTLESGEAYLHKLQSSIKRAIFRPVFMNFPFLDSLGIPSRENARRLAAHFTDQLVAAVVSAFSCATGKPDDGLANRLVAAWQSDQLTEQQFRDNLTVTFVAGQENPQLALLSTMYLLAKYPDAQGRLHDEVMAVGTDTPSQGVLQEMPWLTAVVLESLRLLPPIGQLMNRRAAVSMVLDDGILIPEGTYLGYNCYSTNRDPEAWGTDAKEFRPQRLGGSSLDIQKMYRQRRARSEFITFHGGRRACLGERFAMLELKATLFVLSGKLRWRLDPEWVERLTPVSCYMLAPVDSATRQRTEKGGGLPHLENIN